jgi:hypothetical protein
VIGATLPGMTINLRHRPESHAFVVPVVREIPPPRPVAIGTAW